MSMELSTISVVRQHKLRRESTREGETLSPLKRISLLYRCLRIFAASSRWYPPPLVVPLDDAIRAASVLPFCSWPLPLFFGSACRPRLYSYVLLVAAASVLPFCLPLPPTASVSSPPSRNEEPIEK
ncbi:hypothetical protein PIB30_022546 [Stylosanthes scabra]|uniref:Transmembrane protein n=1 Tax=Stylosanthes scabra TaxID=79078 RepID=A0ABU6XAS2_9FABA|nr:hypothetical protein [Stylosanthes scabra]